MLSSRARHTLALAAAPCAVALPTVAALISAPNRGSYINSAAAVVSDQQAYHQSRGRFAADLDGASGVVGDARVIVRRDSLSIHPASSEVPAPVRIRAGDRSASCDGPAEACAVFYHQLDLRGGQRRRPAQ